jgi:hypothetical protein
MLFGGGKGTQSSRISSISSFLGIEFFPQPAHIFRLVVDNRQHPGKEKKVARL